VSIFITIAGKWTLINKKYIYYPFLLRFMKNIIPNEITGVNPTINGIGINQSPQPIKKVMKPHKTGERSSESATFTITIMEATKITKYNTFFSFK
jgi:hypothetical protein